MASDLAPGSHDAAGIPAKHKQYMLPALGTFYDEPLVPWLGKGCRITDTAGRIYLDFFGGILTISLGHGYEPVDQAVIAQIQRFSHVSTFYPAIPMVELAEKLVTAAPGRLEKVFFSATGTEANETAVALAQAGTGNQEIVALRYGYSGRSMLAQALDGMGGYRALPTQVAAVKHAMAPYCYRCPMGLEPGTCGTACAKDVEALVRSTTTGRIAGMLVEPILGAGGCIAPPPDYFAIVAEVIRRHGGVMIADEVQTGCGRTGKMWGVQHYGLEPEIMTLGKGIANGLPLAATLCTEAIGSAFKGTTISTFGGNPVSCAAASVVLDEIQKQALEEQVRARGIQLKEELTRIQRRHPKMIGDVRGVGLMQALELVQDETVQDRTPAPKAVLMLLEESRKRGLLLGKGGPDGNVVRLGPPLNVSEEEIKEAAELLADAFLALHRH